MLLPRPATAIAMLFGLATTALTASTYYVDATSGSDSDRTPAQAQIISSPWKTIQKAANNMVAGDTCLIRAGTYRETVIVPVSGTAVAPVTFRPYGTEDVNISGAEPITAWTLESTHIYRATNMPSGWSSLGNGNQVFQDGVMKPEARWPNAGASYPWQNSTIYPSPDWGYVDTAGYDANGHNGWFTDAGLPARTGTNYWAGARVHAMAGLGWIMTNSVVTSTSNQNQTLVTDDANGTAANNWAAISTGDAYYLSGIKGEMDSDGEWFYDTTTSRLCFYSSTGAPANVQVKTRPYGFNLSGHTFITLKNLRFSACTILTNSASINCVFDGLNMKYLNHSSATSGYCGLTLRTGCVLRNSELAFDSRGLVALDGTDIRVINNTLHDSGYEPSWTRMLEAVNSDTNTNCARNLVSHNTLRDSGRSLVGFTGRESIIEYNDMSYAMKLTTDGGIYYATNRAGGNTVFRYNLLHDSKGPIGSTGPVSSIMGLYLDNVHNGWVIHHNIIWGIPGNAMHFGNRQNFNMVFNNTCWDAAGGALSTYLLTDGETGSNIFNNLFTAAPTGGEAVWARTNLRYNRYSDPTFAAGSFQLAAGSPAINSGKHIPGITDGYLGSAPDQGALEYGAPDWTGRVGYNASVPPSPDPTYAPYPVMDFANKVIDGSFESGSLSPNWSSSGSNISLLAGNAWSDPLLRTGSYVLKFAASSATSEVWQSVTGLLANRKYKLYCGVQKPDTNSVVNVGVRNYNGSEAALEVTVPVNGNWQSALHTADNMMFTLPFITGNSSAGTQIYVRVTTPNASVYVDDLSVQLVPDEPVYAPSEFQSEQKFEAETLPLNKSEGAGTNGIVGVYSGLAQASNTAAVTLFDVGDKITLSFTASKTGLHQLKVRLRSGYATNQIGYINAYAFKVDGKAVAFTDEGVGYVNDNSGGSNITWGTVSSPSLVLATGTTHTLEITALQQWLLVDYLQTFVQKVYEAESPVNVIADVGSTSIGAASGFDQASNGTAVWLNDIGDTIRINFTAAQGGNHLLKVRVRSGYPSNDRAYFNSGYTFKVDGQPVVFTGDAESIVPETKPGWMANTVWGTMISPNIYLAAGSHSVDVTAVYGYGQVDYLETYVQKVIEAEAPLDVVADPGTNSISVANGFDLASGGGAVWLNDIGDTIRMDFTVDRPGNNILKLRVRAGDPTVDRSFFSNGYSFKVNGQQVIFTGDVETIIQETKPGWMSDTMWGTMTSPVLTLPAGSNHIEIRAEHSSGQVDCLEVLPLETRLLDKLTGNPVSVGTRTPTLPVPWQTSDIGAVGVSGATAYTSSNQTFTLDGSGAGIDGNADALRCVYQTAIGDCDVWCQVTGIDNTNPWAGAGVMIRETLAADSKCAMMGLTPANGAAFQCRTTTSGTSAKAVSAGTTAPYWVRVSRTGNTFRGYISADGTTWTQVGGGITIAMTAAVYIGTWVSSANNGSLCTATQANVTGWYSGVDYSSWATACGMDPTADGSPGADSDHDGMPNGIEFVVGSNPNVPDMSTAAYLPAVSLSGTDVVFVFRRTDASAYLNPAVQTSTTLENGTWTDVTSGIVVDDNYYEAGVARVSVTVPRGSSPDLFLRLKVSVP